MSLSTYQPDYAHTCHLGQLRRHHCYAYVPQAVLPMITMRKSIDGFPFLSYMNMGLRLAAPL